jgi:hypothetical protein
MSIPRLAIERPVTMFMLSGVIMLIGGLSLMRLPVDLMPDISLPSITVRVGYPGVGPLEIEELVTRPLEQALSAVAGLEQSFTDEELFHRIIARDQFHSPCLLAVNARIADVESIPGKIFPGSDMLKDLLFRECT